MDSDLLHTAIKATQAVAPVLRHFQAQPIEVFTKADHSPVTAADQAAHDLIYTFLSKTGYPIVSEEGAMEESPIAYPAFWLVDPLDGTKEFIKKSKEFTVNIAFIKHGVAIGGVIGIPMEGTIWVGSLDKGLHILTEDDVAHGVFEKKANIIQHERRKIVTSLSHPHPKITEFIAKERLQFPELEVVAAGSSLKFCQTAIGSNTIYPRFSPCMLWDVAAGDAILRAAGKKITQLSNGDPINYNAASWIVPPFIAE
ncbi:MAG: 3'(2'),5'-bisphosphate nucleotidase CysQ [Cryomorphaceae bacterium]|nr:3'(2'),5'-bisphosphate nucleotidase CysQ [Cryomorphaceae bacterium]